MRIKSALALAALAGALLLSPFHSEDAAKRIVVQTLCVYTDGGAYAVRTDAGLFGRGADPASAFADLQRTAPGLPTLSAARQLVVSEDALVQLSELVFLDCMHPGTEVYRSAGHCLRAGRPHFRGGVQDTLCHPCHDPDPEPPQCGAGYLRVFLFRAPEDECL